MLFLYITANTDNISKAFTTLKRQTDDTGVPFDLLHNN